MGEAGCGWGELMVFGGFGGKKIFGEYCLLKFILYLCTMNLLLDKLILWLQIKT